MTGEIAPLACVSHAALGRMMPLHLVVDASGRITSHGPTLGKLTGAAGLDGKNLFEVFDILRPAGIADMAGLAAQAGQRLRLDLRPGGKGRAFRGLALPLEGEPGFLINLSFGIGVVDAVRLHALTDGDFAPTDLAIELMYLVEANTATMGALRDLAERLEGDKRLAEAEALTDTLTGLRNRRALNQTMDVLAHGRVPFGLMHMDLDFFKTVNDTLGHAAGDHVLRHVAGVLRAVTRGGDTVARVGGDEFVLVFPGQSDSSILRSLAQRIIDETSRPIDFEGQACRVSASIGITMSTFYDPPQAHQMHADADEALYASKHAGRGQAQFFRGESPDRRRA